MVITNSFYNNIYYGNNWFLWYVGCMGLKEHSPEKHALEMRIMECKNCGYDYSPVKHEKCPNCGEHHGI